MLKQLRMMAVLCALLVLPLSAAAQDYKYFSVDIPQDWKQVSTPREDNRGNFMLVLGRKDHSSAVTLVAGPSGGMDAESLAKKLAKSMGATSEPKEDRGQYRFECVRKGKKNVVCVAADPKADLWMTTIVTGDIQAAKPVLESVRSDKYPLLIAK